MIQLSFTSAFLFYLGATLFIVLGLWIFSHYKTRQKIILSSEKTLFVCEFCHFTYLEESIKKLNQCPQCGLLNKKNQFGKFKQIEPDQ